MDSQIREEFDREIERQRQRLEHKLERRREPASKYFESIRLRRRAFTKAAAAWILGVIAFVVLYGGLYYGV